MTTLNSRDLQAYMEVHGIHGAMLHLDSPTPTVEAAAQAVGCSPEQIVKSILFLVGEEPVLAVTCGTRPIERRALAVRYGVGRKRVKLADADRVLEVSGYEVGAMPPFGHRRPLPTLLDPRVLEHEEVYAGGGEENALVRLSPLDIQRFARAEVADLHERAERIEGGEL